MSKKFLTALIAMLLPCVAAADGASFQCTMDDQQRRVEILTEPGVAVPCEVHYYKDTEAPGTDQVLWSATSQEGYCESKAAEFKAKLEEWGWNCDQSEQAMPASPAQEPQLEAPPQEETPVTDDTADLQPAAPSDVDMN